MGGAYLGEAGAEACEHLAHVASLLHADDTQVVLLVDPHQEGLVVVVPAGEREARRAVAQGSIRTGSGFYELSEDANSSLRFNWLGNGSGRGLGHAGDHTDQMPRASGQSRAIPDASSRGETGLSNRKWSSISCCCSSSVMFFRA